MALSTQYASEFASFRHGMTTDTSTAGDTPRLTGCVPSEVSTVPIAATSYRALLHISRAHLFGYSAAPRGGNVHLDILLVAFYSHLECLLKNSKSALNCFRAPWTCWFSARCCWVRCTATLSPRRSNSSPTRC